MEFQKRKERKRYDRIYDLMHGGIAGDAVGACMRNDRVADRQAGQAAEVVCRGHAGECPDSERISKEESRMKLTLEKAKATEKKRPGDGNPAKAHKKYIHI